MTWRERGRLWVRLGVRLLLAVGIVLVLRYLVPPLLSLLMPFVLALITASSGDWDCPGGCCPSF